jgi:hypothetical protein
MKSTPINHNADRRKFIGQLGTIAGTAALSSTPFAADAITLVKPDENITVGQIIDLFMKQVPGAPFPNTVDTLKAGNRDIQVTGIVTTMFATIEVIRKAIGLGPILLSPMNLLFTITRTRNCVAG